MGSDDRERHFNLHTTPEVMAGVYANFATVSHSDYEFTLTFSRVDHEVEADEVPGVVVSRVSVSHQAMRELIDAMEDNWSKWQTREGIKRLPEIRDRPDYSRSQRLADPLHRRGVGAEQHGLPARRVRVADVLQRDPALEAHHRVRLAGHLQRERVGAALDRARELIGDRRHDGRGDREREQDGGDRRGARRVVSFSPTRATTSVANGATSASHSRPCGTSR